MREIKSAKRKKRDATKWRSRAKTSFKGSQQKRDTSNDQSSVQKRIVSTYMYDSERFDRIKFRNKTKHSQRGEFVFAIKGAKANAKAERLTSRARTDDRYIFFSDRFPRRK